MLSLHERFSRPWSFIPLLAFLMTSLALSAMAGEEVMKDGTLHVINGAEPSGGRQTMNLEELWRVGGEDDEETVFGIITKVLIDDDNNIYLLDAQLSEISVFSPEGELINTLGREGEGPGDLRSEPQPVSRLEIEEPRAQCPRVNERDVELEVPACLGRGCDGVGAADQFPGFDGLILVIGETRSASLR